MPLYEYHCEDCGADFEALVPFAYADEIECEFCHSRKIARVNSSFTASTAGESVASLRSSFPSCGPNT